MKSSSPSEASSLVQASLVPSLVQPALEIEFGRPTYNILSPRFADALTRRRVMSKSLRWFENWMSWHFWSIDADCTTWNPIHSSSLGVQQSRWHRFFCILLLHNFWVSGKLVKVHVTVSKNPAHSYSSLNCSCAELIINNFKSSDYLMDLYWHMQLFF